MDIIHDRVPGERGSWTRDKIADIRTRTIIGRVRALRLVAVTTLKTDSRQMQKSLPLAKELAGEVGLVAIKTLECVLGVAESATAPADMTGAG